MENYNEHNVKGNNFKHFCRIFPLKFAFILKILALKVLKNVFVVLPPHLRCRNPVFCCVSIYHLNRRHSVISALCVVSHPVVHTLDREHSHLALAVWRNIVRTKESIVCDTLLNRLLVERIFRI